MMMTMMQEKVQEWMSSLGSKLEQKSPLAEDQVVLSSLSLLSLISLSTFKVNVASIVIPVRSSGDEAPNNSSDGHQYSFGGAIAIGVPSPGSGKTFRSREEKEEEEAQERRMRRREEEERRRERELFLSGKATPPPAMVCVE